MKNFRLLSLSFLLFWFWLKIRAVVRFFWFSKETRVMDTFTDVYDAKVRPLMDKIDQVRTILSSNEDGISFPSVVVVGDQSSGKSTLLEALSFVELPKGSGIVTRCPLVLRLRKALKRQVYRIHSGNKKDVLDESKLNILSYIEEETKKLAGNQKNVVHDLIELLVEDPNVRDLTVVDLPGIARNPVGDQPKDIHKQTTALINKFINQSGTVILCIFSANVDIATAESFALANKVDPSGVRTIGVITKADLASNEDALVQQLLMERSDTYKLNLGFIAVRNRSAEEKISLQEARRREKEFFRQHPASASVGWHCLGVDALINRLADLYADRIKETFPKMRKDVHAKLKDVRHQLEKFPPALETSHARLAKYYELSEFYVENILQVRFSSSHDGSRVSMANTLHTKLKHFEVLVNKLTKQISTLEFKQKVQQAMAACFGEQLPNFLPHPVLKRLIGEKLDQLWRITDALINECFRLVAGLLVENDVSACDGDILLKKLLPAFRDIVISYLQEKNRLIHSQLQELIRIEKHDPYTTNHYYMNSINKYTAEFADRKAGKTVTKLDEEDLQLYNVISNDDQAVQDMVTSIYCYWKVLIKRFIDYTALFLRAGCDFDVCQDIRERLRRMPGEQFDFVDSYLTEDVYTQTQRKQLQQTKARLEKVDAILGGHSTANLESYALKEATTASSLDALEKELFGTTDASRKTK